MIFIFYGKYRNDLTSAITRIKFTLRSNFPGVVQKRGQVLQSSICVDGVETPVFLIQIG